MASEIDEDPPGRRVQFQISDSSSEQAVICGTRSTKPMAVDRIMKRDMPMHQCWGTYDIGKVGVSQRLFAHNAFYMILQLHSWQLIFICFLLYTLAWLLFARWWLYAAEPCNISLETYRQALYLSIETMVTIGFGVDDPFFNDCGEALPILICQSFTGMLLDIAILGILFQRFSRAYRRSATIIFSRYALVRERGEKLQLAFRIAEMQDSPLLQVTLQAYVVMHRQDMLKDWAKRRETMYEDREMVMIRPLHLQELDVTNNVLLCGLPMTVTHLVDSESPLAPCNRDHHTGEESPTLEQLKEHLEKAPYFEIIVILSGVEEFTGSSVEGRQSYILKEIQWGHEFSRCVSLDSEGRHCVDFKRFHTAQKSPLQLTS